MPRRREGGSEAATWMRYHNTLTMLSLEYLSEPP
eukprot:CAMPEP_0113586380 /NCGR_PEP_ID=MMETSP0015_2-20120614/34263_1 /TAXON_ID=2838 /ORGANISM="Odontella" /LENGTH=33 /DNA_ID=CAMNT_0000491807 /DNA_START=157 /DNA_END=255 /DNA_ORIENTATION=+ /assembly_acc=CAM_ASM_000160